MMTTKNHPHRSSIINMVDSNAFNIVGYSNVVSYLEQDVNNINDANSIKNYGKSNRNKHNNNKNRINNNYKNNMCMQRKKNMKDIAFARTCRKDTYDFIDRNIAQTNGVHGDNGEGDGDGDDDINADCDGNDNNKKNKNKNKYKKKNNNNKYNNKEYDGDDVDNDNTHYDDDNNDDAEADTDADDDADDGNGDGDCNVGCDATDATTNVNVENLNDGYIDVETDSLASLETLSDNVAIWVDGERHWVSGVDANTTCTDLICALLNYHHGQQMVTQSCIGDGGGGCVGGGDRDGVKPDQDNQKDTRDKNNKSNKRNNNNNCYIDGNNAINQSLSNTNGEIESRDKMAQPQSQSQSQSQPHPYAQQNHEQHQPQVSNSYERNFGLARSLALASEYAIVRQYPHCEEYLDGSAKVFDVLPPTTKATTTGILSDGNEAIVSARKQCELFLRRLTASQITTAILPQHVGNTQVASLLSTDKDSGMGSPVGSSRSARFRRRKHKSATWFAQGNTLHPKVTQRGFTTINVATDGDVGGNFHTAAAVAAIANASNGSDNAANERLMRIILAQDETIHRQLSLLREKERQISKIEEEKHRVRERELGKNYLLETYLNGLDEAACEINNDEDEEIFIDEPYQHLPASIKATEPNPDSAMATNSNIRSSNARHKTNKANIPGKVSESTKDNQQQVEKKNSHHHPHYYQHQNQHQRYHRHHSHSNNHKEQIQQLKHLNEDDARIKHSDTNNIKDEKHCGDATATTTATATATTPPTNADNQKEIELQIFWLEKVYALNKQLQREEETLLKLHAKIRKHQVRCAYQMKNDVLQQIDELDAKLALQCADICRVEDNLVTSDEMLKSKLDILEKLRAELQETTMTTTIATMATSTLPPAQPISLSKEIDTAATPTTTTTTTTTAIPTKSPAITTLEKMEITTSDFDISDGIDKIQEVNREFTLSGCLQIKADVHAHQSGIENADMKSRKRKPIMYFDNNREDLAQNPGIAKAEPQNRITTMEKGVSNALTTAVIAPLPHTINCTATSIQQQQQQQEQQSNKLIQPEKPYQAISHINQLLKCSANDVSQSNMPMAKMLCGAATNAEENNGIDDKNILPQHSINAKIMKKPIFEALSLNQMPKAVPMTTTMTMTMTSMGIQPIAATTTPLTTTSNLTPNSINGCISSSNNNCNNQMHQQQLVSVHAGSLLPSTSPLPLREATSVDISYLGTLV